mmetsp:Transcript_41891/g.87941  ORF Transcript_41891/g.87941 Transcript_41891/m.87941 type:complete len:207 (+) Transcript_41891:276-896(+)
MYPERGLQAAIGIVMMFSLLWTIAILIPDDNHSGKNSNSKRHLSNPLQFGLVVNGTRYILEADVGTYQPQANKNVHLIHSVSPNANNKKLKVSSNGTKRAKQESQPSPRTAFDINAPSSSTGQTRKPLFPRWAWFLMFLVYHARRLLRRREISYYEEDWFVKSGLDARLEYYGDREYEDDFLSVDGSFYGTMSNRWNGEELNKFDV